MRKSFTSFSQMSSNFSDGVRVCDHGLVPVPQHAIQAVDQQVQLPDGPNWTLRRPQQRVRRVPLPVLLEVDLLGVVAVEVRHADAGLECQQFRTGAQHSRHGLALRGSDLSRCRRHCRVLHVDDWRC